MMKTIQLGDRMISEPVEIPQGTIEVLRAVLAQQQIMVEMHLELIRALSATHSVDWENEKIVGDRQS
jgi:type IV secretory pathway ATPase VirB11/archaellum biosynthesis ATPase